MAQKMCISPTHSSSTKQCTNASQAPSAKNERLAVMPTWRRGPRQAEASARTRSSTSASSTTLSNVVQGAISSVVIVVVAPISSRRPITTTTRARTTTLVTFASNSRSTATSVSSSTMTAATSMPRLSPTAIVPPSRSGTMGTSINYTPPPPPDEGPLSPFAQLGVSFAVGFGVLFIAAAIAISIWYRRQAARHNSGMRRPNLVVFAKRILKRNKNENIPEDAERRLGSANGASVTRSTQEESISTVSRLHSRASEERIETGRGDVGGQHQEMSLALTNNPVMPPLVVARVRFSETPSIAIRGSEEKTEHVKSKHKSWPLKS
ncbi:hypothetical protein FB567DRAFT_549802 [Paraphoma chrysanthemicola]|uniref:Transmembrane protein n=1 Tax=Paraphoma chrysanthemicola TaxID=798071 RepID=A0A8K0R2L8_9PLEO|nr:hypothetical protein FB567DRAFT_549802 [Paraphoma chrysanthemicola]